MNKLTSFSITIILTVFCMIILGCLYFLGIASDETTLTHTSAVGVVVCVLILRVTYTTKKNKDIDALIKQIEYNRAKRLAYIDALLSEEC